MPSCRLTQFLSEIVDEDFHVQYSTKGKWYRYVMDQHRFTDPFNRLYRPLSISFRYFTNAASS